VSARDDVNLAPALGHVRNALLRTGLLTKTECTNIGFGLLDELLCMDKGKRAALARALVPECAILPADMTEAQAARSLAGSGLAQRLRVSSPETYAEMVERRRATWREMVAVMGESGDE
jgi:hypothetical protein